MATWARWKSPGVPEVFYGDRDIIDAEGTRHPRNVVHLWTDEELRAIGLMPYEVTAMPEGHRVIGHEYFERAGKIVDQPITEALPPDPPDPQAELEAAIAAATTLEELKTALLGQSRSGKIGGRPL